MRVLKSWLKDFVDITISDEKLAAGLVSTSGFDIESVEKTLDERIIVGEIRQVKPHPNADRLRLATVFDGTTELEVVCGAPNIEAGQKVPLALAGAKVGETEIKKAAIRGVESNGMMCSERELGLGDDHAGIKILPGDAIVGVPAANYLPSDTVIDLEVTPNRGDCLSHLGIAREIAAFTDQQVSPSTLLGTSLPAGQPLDSTRDKLASRSENTNSVKVKIQDSDLCPRYYALMIKDVKIGPSPDWLKNRLTALKVKPINNVVDATNYIMLDLGQPLHAFDADKVAGKSIIIRRSTGEIFTTLDEKPRTLDSDMLVIADTDKPLALAGIMGGLESGVTSKTTDIILEAAEFDSKNIRKTSKSLGLATDASYRFERGVDPLGIEYALKKAARIIEEIAGGTACGDIARDGKDFERTTIELPYDKINSLLGLDLPTAEIDHILSLLGFRTASNNETMKPWINAIIPSWRHDISLWQDLAEEVGRLYGYDKIPEHEVSLSRKPVKSVYYLKEHIKDTLVSLGFSEVKNYPFLSEADLKTAGLEANDLLEVANPVQLENKYLRSSLLPNMLKNIAKNPAFDPVLIFEVGNVFSEQSEQTMLGAATSGKGARKSLTQAKEALVSAGVPADTITISELTRDELARFKIRKPAVYSFEIPIEAILGASKFEANNLQLRVVSSKPSFRPVSLFPPVTRDIALITGNSEDPKAIADDIYTISGSIVLVELFDEFSSPKFGQGKKSLAYHIFLQQIDRTLTDKEADEVMSSAISMLKEKYGAEIR